MLARILGDRSLDLQVKDDGVDTRHFAGGYEWGHRVYEIAAGK